ncbi:MAG: ArsR/SmtB family transcription factor [Candidatus Nanosalina sp.]
MFHYLVKEDEFLPAKEIDEAGLDALRSDQRRKILNLVSDRDMTVSEIEEEMDIGRQTLYYNLEKLQEGSLITSEGSSPKYYSSDIAAYYFRPENVEPEENPVMLESVPEVLRGFVENQRINARIVVGAPYPHGPSERRHKSAYKAGELACVLGNYGRRREQIVYTDTEMENKSDLEDRPIISVAGPLVNTVSEGLNGKLPARFTESHDRILTEDNTYSSDEVGFVARREVDGNLRMVAAGLYGLGTSAAIEALAKNPGQLGENGAVVRGYGTKQSIEEVEILEKL